MRCGIALFTLLLLAASVPRAHAAGPALVLEASDGKVLYAEDADHLWHPASLTKIMTAYIVFEEIKAGKLGLESKIACSAAANAQPPSKIGLAVGNEMTLHLALQSLIIKSANDVAVMLAEAVSGTEDQFVMRMNVTAKRLGMTNTNFVNPNGLPAPAQVTTARDLAMLARAMTNDFPEHQHYWKQAQMRIGQTRLTTHNKLLQSFEGADGMKTGFICDSGFNVVATASRGGRRVIAVVLGGHSSAERNSRAASLLEYGFEQTGWKSLFNSTTVDNMPLGTPTPVRSVRTNITSWSCNPQQRPVEKKKKKQRPAKDTAEKRK
jgi:D-alanyl-D-alanine carboxypeptidase